MIKGIVVILVALCIGLGINTVFNDIEKVIRG